VGLAGAGACVFDDGAQLGSAVKRGAADACTLGDGGEGDGLAGVGELGADGLDSGEGVICHDA
jgi:hypothetical protein